MRRVAGSWPASRSAATTFGKRAGSIAVMSRWTAGSPVSSSSRWIARATASRGCSSSTKRSPPASCSVAPSPRTASLTRNPSRPGMPTTAVGWNCANSRSASSAPAARRQQQARAVRARRVGGARPQRRRAARGEDHGAGGRRAPVVARHAADPAVAGRRAARARGGPRARSIRFSSTASAESWRRIRRPVALPPACTTRRMPWPPSRPSARLPWRSASKRTPSASRSAKRAGASSHRTCAAVRRTSPRPAVSVSCEVLRGASRRPRGPPRARPAPSRRPSRRGGGRRRA